jgi:signal peptidase I
MPEFTSDTLERALADLAADLGDPGSPPFGAVERSIRRHHRRRHTALAGAGAVASALLVTGVVLGSGHSARPATAGTPITTITVLFAGMENTLSVGERVSVVADPAISRGDIIAFDPDRGCDGALFAAGAKPCTWTQDISDEDGASADLVERVIAVGGDTVSCPPVADNPSYCDSVVVDGQALDEPYVFEDNHQIFAPVRVPAGQLYVLGDHRGDSSDSRYDGTLAVTSVIGKVELPK